MAKAHDIEDVYPLSPLQQGLLFHTLEAPGSGVYFGQFTCLLEGKLDVDALEGAWRQAVDRHPVLRTAFFWEGLDDPVQVVFARTTVPFEREDWRDLPSEEQDRRLDNYLRANAESGFVLSEAPLMRLALFRLADETYRLVWSHHHLLLDGWSVSLLIAEIFACYGSLAQGEDFHLAQPRPYRDYIEWLQRQDLMAAERFWREALAGFGSPTPLGDPAVWPEPVVRTDRRFRLSADATAALRSFVAQHQLTLNTLVQGAWALLLAHFSGETDVVFGGVTSGRPASLPGAERMLGLFINTLPVRAEVRGDARISDWLHDLQVRQALVRRYEFSPLSSVQRWSEVPSQKPLFESLLVFENYPVGEALREQVVSVEVRDLRFIGKTNYPLSVVVDPGRELQLRISYDQPRFAGAEILRLWDHFARLLAGIVAAPEGRLTDLARLSEAERHQVLWAWNDSSSGATAVPRCLSELFSAQAALKPEATAVRYEGEILTFATLDRASNRLAHHLRRLGVGPEVRVGIYLERSLDWVVSLLGVLKAGGCYVPLEPDSPPERLAYQLADCGASVVLTAERSAQDPVDFSGSVVRLDADREAIGRERETPPVSLSVPENQAYVIYTSGSTGRPKGVGVEHRQLAHYLAGIAERLEAPPGASFALVSTFAADLGYTMILPALCGGGCLHVLSGERMTDPDLLGEYFERHEIDYLKIVPSHLGALLSDRSPARVLPRRMLVLGGEASTPSLIERIESTAPGCRILNHYGPTETTVGVSTYPLPAGWRGPSSSVPLGRPLAGSRLYVVDRGGVPVPP
ncbi:MAG TPA: condensation domain-containing protein, partial [Thermoanaerobaculia bacterium]|nr:condensation domain-containing protein [Thermoanaerobaculia bacterium]